MWAFNEGYRMFDSAAQQRSYASEVALGKLFEANLLNRTDLFITSKLHPAWMSKERAIQAFSMTLKNLKTDYLDLYLIHQPECNQRVSWCKGFLATWREAWPLLEKWHEEGKIRAIGVSQFNLGQMKDLWRESRIKPHVLQAKLDLFQQVPLLRRFCREHNIVYQGFMSLGRSYLWRHFEFNPVLLHPAVIKLSKRYHKTPAQIVLRWQYQEGAVSMPKSDHLERIKENRLIWGYKLSVMDMEMLEELDGFKPPKEKEKYEKEVERWL